MSYFRAMPLLFGTLFILFSSFLPSMQSSAATLNQRIQHQLQQHFAAKLPEADITIVLNSKNDQVNFGKCEKFTLEQPSQLPTGGRLSLRLDCQAPSRWSSYVTGKVRALAPVATTAYPIPRGSLIKQQHLRFIRQDLTQLHQGYYTQPQQILGLSTRRNIPNHTVLTPAMLSAKRLIQKGESVIIEAKRGDLTVRMMGTALEDAAQGEQLRVLNNRSQKEIKAYAVQRGVVTVSP